MRNALAVAREEEVVSRHRVEENAIAVAERVGRELVKMVFSATQLTRTGAAGEAARRARCCGRVAGSADARRGAGARDPPAPAGWSKGGGAVARRD